jgi:uncharacterized protein
MTRDRLFLDTAFIQALLNPRDNYHSSAKQLFPRIRAATEVWITKTVRSIAIWSKVLSIGTDQ